MDEQVNQFAEWMKEYGDVVFFGGAGVSTESKIPDFRSVDGLYNQSYSVPPETILSATYFHAHTEEFYRFYRDKMIFKDAEPNPAHTSLARLEQMGIVKAVITQNIDGLHQKAGSKEVLELHGSVHRNYCMRCRKFFGLDAIINSTGVPKCDECGGTIKPDVVLYEEGLDSYVIDRSVSHIRRAKVLVIGGTSLAVYPAAGLINYFRGNKIILINRDATSRDSIADLIIRRPIGQVMKEALEFIEAQA
ncbi:MAG: NAD-dependent protein deacylase [Lachnospiraceae bacterium]|nr:NAD-dependent protein deacylase [Lachnospiraceae bacterium]